MKLNKKIVVIFLIVFYPSLAYLQLLKCETEQAVSEKFCKEYDLCKVDVYFALSTVIINYDDGFYCPSQHIGFWLVGVLTLLLMVISFVIAYTVDYLYVRYRDI